MNQHEQQCNPWLAILFAPKRAWEVILSRNPYSDYQFWLVILFSSLVLSLTAYFGPGQSMFSTFPSPVFGLIAVGILFIINSSILLIVTIALGVLATWGGRWLGGSGSYSNMYAVLLWAGLPLVYLHGLCLVVMLLGGKPASEALTSHVFGKTPIHYAMFLWISVLVGFGYAEAHKLSVKKGLLLWGVVYVIPMIVLIVLFH